MNEVTVHFDSSIDSKTLRVETELGFATKDIERMKLKILCIQTALICTEPEQRENMLLNGNLSPMVLSLAEDIFQGCVNHYFSWS